MQQWGETFWLWSRYFCCSTTFNPLEPITPPPARRRPYGWLALPLIAGLIWLGTRQSPDPVWLETEHLLGEHPVLIANEPDSLQKLFCEIHGLAFTPGDRTAINRLTSYGSISAVEWNNFRDFCRAAKRQPLIVVSGVTGTKATKQARYAARLLVSSPDNLLEIDCAPQFDLELHKKYIGVETDKGFAPGELLQFWERCHQHPEQRFVAVVDNMDKINPETFFGPELWEALSSPGEAAVIKGQKVALPPNFHLLSVTHLGPGSLIELNAEHFKRLGSPYILRPNARELLAWMRIQAASLAAKNNRTPEEEAKLAALQDTAQQHQFLYYFVKANQLIHDKYAEGYELGQGSNIRYFFAAKDRQQLKEAYIGHVNGMHPGRRPLTESEFSPLDKTIRHNGLEPGSSFIARQIQWLHDTGYFVEVTMVAATALLTALFGWWVFRRREQLIRRYGDRAQQVFSSFEKQAISAEVAGRRLEEIKKEVDGLVLRRRLNYTEGLYFLAFIEDKVKRIEFARNVSENFLELFNTFMEDDVLTENEYLKLRQFLQSIRHKIPSDIYEQFNEKVEQAYAMKG